MTDNGDAPVTRGGTCHAVSECKPLSCGFTYTGYNGSANWKAFHSLAESIDCGPCREHAVDVVSFMHDFVNLGLGKPAYDSNNFHKVLEQVRCVEQACLADGRCPLPGAQKSFSPASY